MYIILRFMKFMGRDDYTRYYLWMALQDFLKIGNYSEPYIME